MILCPRSKPSVVALGAVVLALSLLALAACGGGGDDADETPEPTAEPTARGVEDVAHSVVQIQALDDDLEAVWWGSGTFVTSDGLILTNAHVVDDRFDEYDQLGVATTGESDEPPELAYFAEIAAIDHALDLSVIRIVSDLDGDEVDEEFPTVSLGDSDDVEIGDEIRILGYPSIGGETITFSTGAVSGFTAERSVGNRAWIKTDATIAGGNSGGLAMNADAAIVGVPTVVGTGSGLQNAVDCRPVSDTNRDGVVDTFDDCVPVGGFINGLRPINLALPLIEAAREGREYVSRYDLLEETPEPIDDPSSIYFSAVTFSEGVTDDDDPAKVVKAFPSGATDVCGFWDYEGMVDGLSWEALWFVDGILNETGSILDETWVGGESGDWWVCILDDAGLPDGLYELVFNVDGEFIRSGSAFVGGNHPEVNFRVENESSLVVCYARISPTSAQNWGEDDLGGDVIPAGASFTFKLPAAIYDMLLTDCEDEVLLEEYEIDVTSDTTFTLTD